MSTWQLDPAASQAIADTVASHLGTLGNTDSGDGQAFAPDVFTQIDTNLNQTEHLPQAYVAVSSLLQAEAENQANIMNGLGGAAIGLSSVVSIYQAAGQSMSAELSQAQTEAVTAAGTGDFSYFSDGSH